MLPPEIEEVAPHLRHPRINIPVWSVHESYKLIFTTDWVFYRHEDFFGKQTHAYFATCRKTNKVYRLPISGRDRHKYRAKHLIAYTKLGWPTRRQFNGFPPTPTDIENLSREKGLPYDFD